MCSSLPSTDIVSLIINSESSVFFLEPSTHLTVFLGMKCKHWKMLVSEP